MTAHPHPVPTVAIPSVGDLVSGKYRVDGTAGTGGMGVVLSAMHVELGHRVAIKVLASEEEANDKAVERFIREGKAAASLQSDHVVRIYDVGRLESGAPFMVMELLRGEDLGTYVNRQGAIEPSQAVEWILQACNAIAEAHANGIVHRDLKPANLFLTKRSDGSDCVKVLDFGISKRMASAEAAGYQASLTATRQVVGSPAYMSPEQVRNSRDIDHRVDIWALGMTLYEFLSGRPAFCADTFPAVCAAIIADAPISIRKLTPSISAQLDDVVLRCLEKDPAKRFSSIAELASALLPFAPARAVSIARPQRQALSQIAVDDVAPATLASAHSSNDIKASGPRGVSTSSSDTNRTLCSSGQESARAVASSQTEVRYATSKRSIWLLLGVIGFAFGVTWKLRNSAQPTKPVQEHAAAVNTGQFMVRFESVPPGANVWEGNRLLGVTPLEYSIERTSVAHQARTFALRTENYEPFVVTQSDSARDVVVTAHLVHVPQQKPEINTIQAPSVHSAVRPSHVPASSAGKGGSVAKQADTAPIDIRTQR